MTPKHLPQDNLVSCLPTFRTLEWVTLEIALNPFAPTLTTGLTRPTALPIAASLALTFLALHGAYKP